MRFVLVSVAVVDMAEMVALKVTRSDPRRMEAYSSLGMVLSIVASCLHR